MGAYAPIGIFESRRLWIYPHVGALGKSEIFRFFKSGYAHDRNISSFRRRASNAAENTLIKPNYASVRQSRDSLHRDRHNMTKKSHGGAVL